MEVGSFDHIDTLDQTDATNPDVADVFALPADRLTNLAGKDLLAHSTHTP
jgi:arabinogalactan oligomer/maltooligosaccharide transport system substrate-binding protein